MQQECISLHSSLEDDGLYGRATQKDVLDVLTQSFNSL